MPQTSSVSSASGQEPPAAGRAALPALGVGLLLTSVMLVALVIDQASIFSIAGHVEALYAPFGLHPDPNVLFGILYVSGAIGILLWLVTIWGVRTRKPGARVLPGIVLFIATSFAVFVLLVSEHGTRIYPTAWGLAGLLPCVAGLVAVTSLWRPGRAQERGPW